MCIMNLNGNLACFNSPTSSILENNFDTFIDYKRKYKAVIQKRKSELPPINDRDTGTIYLVKKNEKNENIEYAYYYDESLDEWKSKNKLGKYSLSGSSNLKSGTVIEKEINDIISKLSIPDRIKIKKLKNFFINPEEQGNVIGITERNQIISIFEEEGKKGAYFIPTKEIINPLFLENKKIKQVVVDNPKIADGRLTGVVFLTEEGQIIAGGSVNFLKNTFPKDELQNKTVKQLFKIEEIQNTQRRFVSSAMFALTNTGEVIAWGNPENKFLKNFPRETLKGKKIVKLFQMNNKSNLNDNKSSMVALTEDNKIIVWGDPNIQSTLKFPFPKELDNESSSFINLFSPVEVEKKDKEKNNPFFNDSRVQILFALKKTIKLKNPNKDALSMENHHPVYDYDLFVLGDKDDPAVKNFPKDKLAGKEIVQVFNHKDQGFAAITKDGEVIPWATSPLMTPRWVQNCPSNIKLDQLKNDHVKDWIVTDEDVFFLTKDDKLIPGWGNKDSLSRKNFPQELKQKKVKKVLYDPHNSTLCALTEEGKIIIWGEPPKGQNTPADYYSEKYKKIQKIQDENGKVTDLFQTPAGFFASVEDKNKKSIIISWGPDLPDLNKWEENL